MMEETQLENKEKNVVYHDNGIVTFQIQQPEFFYLGKEYPRNWYEFMDVWSDFDKSGGWAMVNKYRNNSSYNCTVVNHLIDPNGIYMAGTFVNEMTQIPEGFTLKKFSSREYIVVTHQW